MTKENEMPEYVWLFNDPHSIGDLGFTNTSPSYDDDTRYTLCPEGSFVVSREVFEANIQEFRPDEIEFEEGFESWMDDYFISEESARIGFKRGYNQAIHDILKIGESDEK